MASLSEAHDSTSWCPTDLNPEKAIADYALAELDAYALEGRLILSKADVRSDFGLVFMSLVGADTAALATTIRTAAQEASRGDA